VRCETFEHLLDVYGRLPQTPAKVHLFMNQQAVLDCGCKVYTAIAKSSCDLI
jgi:hypothetical protein